MAEYCSPDELRAQIGKSGKDGPGSDVNLKLLISAASEVIDGLCNRPNGFIADTSASAKYYAGSGYPYQRIDECVEVTEVAVKANPTMSTFTVWTSPTSQFAGDGDYVVCAGDPNYPDFNILPFTLLLIDPSGAYGLFTSGEFTTRGGFRPTTGISRGMPTVRVTARWGYSEEVPTQVKEACIALTSRFFKQGEGAWADTLASVEMGRMLYQRENMDIKLMLEGSRLIKPAIGRRL